MMNNHSLKDKVAVITGSSQGIGSAIAGSFVDKGASVVVNGRNEGLINSVVKSNLDKGGEVFGIVADISNKEGVDRLIKGVIERFRHIDILIHNAAVIPFKMLEDMDDETWNQTIDTNLTSCYRLTTACIPFMKARNGGRILFTSSVTGNRTAVSGFVPYAASKSGINGFIKAAAMELAQYNITVNGVEPGLIQTQALNDLTSKEEREAMVSYIPLKRLGDPLDIAHAMLYLASEEAGYVTGRTIVVDGGALLPENGALMQ